MRRRKSVKVAFLSVVLSLLLAFGTLGLGTNFFAKATQKSVSVVKWDEELQGIDGFGGSFAFHKAGSIMRLDEPLRTQILDLLFSQEIGIGLSIVRNIVGDGGIDDWGDKEYDGPTETIIPKPGEYVWDNPN